MRWWCVGGGLKKSPYLSTQMDWQAGVRSEWQAISALASFKWSLYAFVAVCRRRCCRLFLMRPLSFSSPCRLSSPPSLINNNDLSKSSTPLIWLGAAWIKDRTTHLLLHQLTPLMKFFFFLPFSFRTLVCTEHPIRWKQVLLSLEQKGLMWHMCFLTVPFCVSSNFRLSLHYFITFLGMMSLQQQDTRRTQSTLRRFSPVFSLLCMVTRSQLNWSPGENLWECSPCTASQLSAGQRAARRFAWRSIPHCMLKLTVPFWAAAEAVGMQGNISPFPTRRHPHLFIHSLALPYVYFICLDLGQIGWGLPTWWQFPDSTS